MATLLEEKTFTFPTPVTSHEEGIWIERTSQVPALQEVVIRRPVPAQLLRRYAAFAVRRADVRQHPDGSWYAEVGELPGVWAKEPSAVDALAVLEDVAFEWVLLKIQDEDGDLPVLDGIDLNRL